VGRLIPGARLKSFRGRWATSSATRGASPPVTQRLATTQHLGIVCGAYLLRVDNLPLIARGEQHEGVEVEGPTPSTKASMDLVLLLRVSHTQVATCWPACAPKDGVCREEEGEQTTCSDEILRPFGRNPHLVAAELTARVIYNQHCSEVGGMLSCRSAEVQCKSNMFPTVTVGGGQR